MVSRGYLLAANSSSDTSMTTIANNGDGTILILETIHPTVDLRFTTYGARAQCRSLNSVFERDLQRTDSNSYQVKNCSNAGVPELPFNVSSLNSRIPISSIRQEGSAHQGEQFVSVRRRGLLKTTPGSMIDSIVIISYLIAGNRRY